MEIGGVKMLPSGLVTCLVDGKEVRIIELSTEAFIFRTATKLDAIHHLKVCFFCFSESRYEEIPIKVFHVVEQVEEEFYVTTTIATQQEEYRQAASALIKDYYEYIQLKLTGDDGYCSYEKVNYPEWLDQEFASNFEEQKKAWFSSILVDGFEDIDFNQFELAVSIDCPSRYEAYLELGIESYVAKVWEENHLRLHPIAKKKVGRVYLGNQFCHNLFPDHTKLFDLLTQAHREGVNITIVTTYLREELVEEVEDLWRQIDAWCIEKQMPVEVVVNDWGMLEVLKKRSKYIQPVLGVLLNKRRKDPRYSYKSGFETYKNLLAKNSVNSVKYQEYLKQWKIYRYEYEGCGYPVQVADGKHSLHFPYYQTNTSQYCTLYAKCVYQNRGHQTLVTKCPYYCEHVIYSYPTHLNMVGRYNSLFGVDASILQDGKKLKAYLAQGIDRLVMSFL